MERTLVIFKPDAYRRGLVGEIMSRFEKRGLRIAALKVMRPPLELLKAHYAEHKESPFFSHLITMMREGPVVVGVLTGENVVNTVRQMLGKFQRPVPGTIRGDYQTGELYNVMHASDSVATAEREVQLWFRPGELTEGVYSVHEEK